MLRISFIVPVYNVKPYLRQCVESITGQGYDNIEVILVDDESTDGSSALCDELAREYPGIIVVHKKHGGLSRARNAGLEYVTGDYLMYVDSDDFLMSREGLFDKLVETIGLKGYPDFLAYNYSCLHRDGKLAKRNAFDESVCGALTRDEAIKYLVESGTLPVQAWAKFLKTSFVKAKGLMFIEDRLSEDNPWFIDLLDKADSFAFVNEYIYVYRVSRPGSITNSFSLHYCDSIIVNIGYQIDRFPSLRFSEKIKDYYLSFIAMGFCSCMMMLNKLPVSVAEKKWKELRQYDFLLDFDKYNKVHIVNVVRKFIGLNATKWLLQLYGRIR